MPKELVRRIDRIAELADRDRTYVINFFLEEQIAKSNGEQVDVPNDISRARAQMLEEETRMELQEDASAKGPNENLDEETNTVSDDEVVRATMEKHRSQKKNAATDLSHST